MFLGFPSVPKTLANDCYGVVDTSNTALNAAFTASALSAMPGASSTWYQSPPGAPETVFVVYRFHA
jgi:hypothetical protein